MRNHFRRISGIAVALTFGAVALHAGVITSTGTGSFNATVEFAGFAPVQTTVTAAGALLDLDGGMFLFDTSLVDAPGNTRGFAFNFPSPSSAVEVFFTLGAVAPDLSAILLNGVGAVAVPPVTDPVLAELLNPSQFAFALMRDVTAFDGETGDGTLVYSFVSGQAIQATPEPGTLALLASGGLLLVVKRRRK